MKENNHDVIKQAGFFKEPSVAEPKNSGLDWLGSK